MRKLAVVLFGAVILSAGLWTATVPASALGACGPNGHRGPFGHCRFGGQNQAWCLRHTGHVATRGPHGTLWCR
ncbi:GCG_CRPN prefix-to-repeats domain-containing protein [Lichenihabitans sp. PAMC28606]|uniref:GCG_CRPN prefix-to-repeats domain-containing protein n=1 Tax=Lichenihabitans sp. PAMC28606 TaxID=2880932 RepID=UPI0039B66802